MSSASTRGRAAITLALALAACFLGEDYEPRYLQANDEYPAPSGEVQVADWSLALAKARCSFLERCNDYELQGRFYRDEPCLEYFRAYYEDTLDVPALVAQRHVTWNAAAFGSCVHDLARRGCEEYSRPRACYEGHGTLSEGEECSADAECGSDLFCQYDVQCGGRCKRTLPAGERCQYRFQCANGLDCVDITQNAQGSWGHCRVPAKRGMECDDSDEDPCGPGMRCEIWTGYDHTGSCKPLEPGWHAPGQADVAEICSTGTVCLHATECRPAEVLDAGIAYAVRRCVEAIAVGERCLRADLARLSACAQGSYCEADADVAYGACVPRIEQGGECTGVDPHECLEGLACDPDSFTCLRRRRALRGEPCKLGSDCYSEECRDGACTDALCP